MLRSVLASALVLLTSGCLASPSGGSEADHTDLPSAVQAGDTKSVERLLADGADPNGVIPETGGRPVLFEAARTGDPSLVALLLEAGADAGAIHPGTKRTVLQEACLFPEPALFELLLNGVPDLDWVDPQGSTALHVCGNVNQGAMVLALLEAGADPLLVDRSGETFQGRYFGFNQNVLNERALEERREVAAWLEARGIEVDPRA